MDKVRIYYDPIGRTLTVWLGDPESEVSCDEADDDTVFMKNSEGRIIGFEKLNVELTPGVSELEVEVLGKS